MFRYQCLILTKLSLDVFSGDFLTWGSIRNSCSEKPTICIKQPRIIKVPVSSGVPINGMNTVALAGIVRAVGTASNATPDVLFTY